jgi:hypothetical protein
MNEKITIRITMRYIFIIYIFGAKNIDTFLSNLVKVRKF